MAYPEPGPGYVRVLLERPTGAALVQAANALAAGARPDRFLHEHKGDRAPRDFLLDPSFGALPIGPGRRGITEARLQDLVPETSARFLVRGFIKADESGIPEQLDGEYIHSDPLIGAHQTCGASRAVGSTSNVRANLGAVTLAANRLDGSGVAIAVIDSGIFRPHLDRQLLPSAPLLDVANSWRPASVSTPPGIHRLGHGTMCAYDALIMAPFATLLDIPILIDRSPGEHRAEGTISAALQGYW